MSSGDIPLRYALIKYGRLSATSNPAERFLSIQMVKNHLMSSMSDMGCLSVVDPFGMSAMVSTLNGLGMMRWLREKMIICSPTVSYCDGIQAKMLRVKLLWRVNPGIDLIPGSIYTTGVVVVGVGVVVVSDVSNQDHWRTG